MMKYREQILTKLEETEEKAKKEITDGAYVLENVNYDKDDAVVAWALKAKKGEVTNIAEVEDHEHSDDTSKDNHADLEKVYTVAILTKARGRDESISSRDVRHILFKSTTYADDSKVKVFVIATNEELAIARDTLSLIS